MNTAKDLITEVQKDISHEKIMNFLINYGKYIVTSILLFLLGFSIYIYLHNESVNKQKSYAEEYQNIFISNSITLNKEHVIENYITKTKSTIFEYLATLHYSKLLAENNQVNKSIELLLPLSEKKQFPEIANLSLVLASEISITKQAKNYREPIIKAMTKKIAKNDKSIPHFYIMQIMLISLMIEEGQLDNAKNLLKTMDDNAPPNISLLRNTLSNTIFTKTNA